MCAELVPPVPLAPAVRIENVQRGTPVASATVPVGVILWGFGFIASLVAALVAFLALRL